MLRWRLILGAALIAALAAGCWLDLHSTGLVLAPLSLVVVLLASGEIIWLLRSAGIAVRPSVVYAGNLSLIASAWLPQWFALPSWPGGLAGVALVFVFWLLVALAVECIAYRKPGGITARLAATLFALAYVGLLASFWILLRLLPPVGAKGLVALVSLVIVVKMCDIGAYTVGRLVGRHKMAPYLSPGKTIEGAVGGIVFALLGAWLAFDWLLPWLAGGHVSTGRWLAFGVVIGASGIFGDLAESLLKRDLGRKDSSTWLPGFGGVLDIVDSVLWAAPVAYAFWIFGWVDPH